MTHPTKTVADCMMGTASCPSPSLPNTHLGTQRLSILFQVTALMCVKLLVLEALLLCAVPCHAQPWWVAPHPNQQALIMYTQSRLPTAPALVTSTNSTLEAGVPRVQQQQQRVVKSKDIHRNMTMHKSQGQTLRMAGRYLPNAVFSNGQLHVALPRVGRRQAVRVLVEGG